MKNIRRPQKTAMYKFEKINGKYAKIVKNTSKNFQQRQYQLWQAVLLEITEDNELCYDLL